VKCSRSEVIAVALLYQNAIVFRFSLRWQVVGEYVDRSSGAKESRPALNRLMADAHQRKFDVLPVWKIDRFGRSLKHLVNALAELEAVGVAFVSLRDNLDLGTPSGRLLFQIIAAMAEFARTLIAERVRAGLANAKKKGKKLGRPRVAVDVERVAALRRSGASWQAISKELRVGVGTLYKAVNGEKAADTAVSSRMTPVDIISV
jgi:DNA invertase Pin-like site-specific DNA recombinase